MHEVTAELLRCRLPATFMAERPAGIVLSPYRREFASEVHGLLEAAYATGAGTIATFASWLREFERDEEFEAECCFLALRDGQVVGVALCWSSAFLKDLAVCAEERDRGLGTFLIRSVCDHFASRGATHVDLKVEVTNDAARRLYVRLGFEPVNSG